MIIDFEHSDHPPLNTVYDVCIAGAGVAGITLSKHLADSGLRVLLLEGGGFEHSEQSQDLYKGLIVGRDYFDLDYARLRYLGGTSNHWGGWCRPLDASDFNYRPTIPGSGWPINREDLDPYLNQARGILDIEEFPADITLPGSSGRLKEIWFRFSTVNFKTKYREYLAASDKVTVLINANLVDIPLNENGTVGSFRFRSYNNKQTWDAIARAYVLALGGIENARALLNANRQQPQGLGNSHDQVGRYFLEHPHFTIGYILFDRPNVFGKDERFLAPTPELQRTEEIANCGVRIVPQGDPFEGGFLDAAKTSLKSALCSNKIATELTQMLKSDFRCRVNPWKLPDLPTAKAAHLRIASEQAPNPYSRVFLTTETDKFGLRRAALDWRLSVLDKKTIRVCGLAVGSYVATQGLGRAKLYDWVLIDSDEFPGFDEEHEVAGFHHMGTTRMGATGMEGVVDRDCRVFGISNLYVAGSSVFRTAGHANPTFTIIQLALRLTNELINTLR